MKTVATALEGHYTLSVAPAMYSDWSTQNDSESDAMKNTKRAVSCSSPPPEYVDYANPYRPLHYCAIA
jgi:hypothetical protein